MTAANQRRLEGRRILVTGAASGIGRATAESFAREGAALALLDVAADPLAVAAEQTNALALAVDLADLAIVPGTVDRAAEHLGGLDGVVNCAGVPTGGPLGAISVADWNRAIAINLTAPFLICQAAVRHFDRGGSIVNVASGVGIRPDTPNVAPYAASKGGLIALTKALAAELAPRIRANAVCPGLTRTPMTAFMFDGYEDPSRAPAVGRYALARPAEPDEIAEAILFLTADASSYITGVTLAVDGGRTFH